LFGVDKIVIVEWEETAASGSRQTNYKEIVVVACCFWAHHRLTVDIWGAFLPSRLPPYPHIHRRTFLTKCFPLIAFRWQLWLDGMMSACWGVSGCKSLKRSVVFCHIYLTKTQNPLPCALFVFCAVQDHW